MADVKVSALPVLASGDLDLVNDSLMVVDQSSGQSKRMAPGEMIRAALPFLSSLYDFTPAVMPAGVAVTRGSTGWHTNNAGVLVPETTNVPRFQCDPVTFAPQGLLCEAAVTNAIRNNTMVGAVAGTPGTAPTNWVMVGTLNGITREIIGTGTEDGIEYLDVRYSGTPTLTSDIGIYADMPAALLGQTWTGGFFLRLIAGSWANTTPRLQMLQRNGVGAVVGSAITVNVTPTSAALRTQFLSQTSTLTEPTTANLVQRFDVVHTNGLPIDFTVRIGLPQLTQLAAVTTPIKTSGSAVTRPADFVLITNPQVLADRCFIVRARTPKTLSGVQSATLIEVDDGTFNNRRLIYYDAGRLYVRTDIGGAPSGVIDMGAVANDTEFVIAARFADGNFGASLNGGAIVKSLTGSNPLGLSRTLVGWGWNSTIKTIETRRTATDAELPLLAA